MPITLLHLSRSSRRSGKSQGFEEYRQLILGRFHVISGTVTPR